MLDLLHREVFGETLDAHIAKYFGIDAAALGLSKSSWTLARSWRPLRLFIGVKRIQKLMRRSTVSHKRQRS